MKQYTHALELVPVSASAVLLMELCEIGGNVTVLGQNGPRHQNALRLSSTSCDARRQRDRLSWTMTTSPPSSWPGRAKSFLPLSATGGPRNQFLAWTVVIGGAPKIRWNGTMDRVRQQYLGI